MPAAELRHRGMVVNSKKIRLMREHDLQPKRAVGGLWPRPTATTIIRSS